MGERLCPWRPRPTEEVLSLMERVTSTPLYLINRMGPTSFLVREDGRQQRHKVVVGARPTCTCCVAGAMGIKELCLHILFVMIKVLRVPPSNPLTWQLSLTDRELDEVLRCSLVREHVPSHDELSAARPRRPLPDQGQVPRRALEEEEACPICHDEMEGCDPETMLVWCRYGCGKQMHGKCMGFWREQQVVMDGKELSCPLCRSGWGDFKWKPPPPPKRARVAREDQRPDVHPGTRCGGCRKAPLVGKRYCCLICGEFDLCDTCFADGQHAQHPFVCKDTSKSYAYSAQRAVLMPTITRLANAEASGVNAAAAGAIGGTTLHHALLSAGPADVSGVAPSAPEAQQAAAAAVAAVDAPRNSRSARAAAAALARQEAAAAATGGGGNLAAVGSGQAPVEASGFAPRGRQVAGHARTAPAGGSSGLEVGSPARALPADGSAATAPQVAEWGARPRAASTGRRPALRTGLAGHVPPTHNSPLHDEGLLWLLEGRTVAGTGGTGVAVGGTSQPHGGTPVRGTPSRRAPLHRHVPPSSDQVDSFVSGLCLEGVSHAGVGGPQGEERDTVQRAAGGPTRPNLGRPAAVPASAAFGRQRATSSPAATAAAGAAASSGTGAAATAVAGGAAVPVSFALAGHTLHQDDGTSGMLLAGGAAGGSHGAMLGNELVHGGPVRPQLPTGRPMRGLAAASSPPARVPPASSVSPPRVHQRPRGPTVSPPRHQRPAGRATAAAAAGAAATMREAIARAAAIAADDDVVSPEAALEQLRRRTDTGTSPGARSITIVGGTSVPPEQPTLTGDTGPHRSYRPPSRPAGADDADDDFHHRASSPDVHAEQGVLGRFERRGGSSGSSDGSAVSEASEAYTSFDSSSRPASATAAHMDLNTSWRPTSAHAAGFTAVGSSVAAAPRPASAVAAGDVRFGASSRPAPVLAQEFTSFGASPQALTANAAAHTSCGAVSRSVTVATIADTTFTTVSRPSSAATALTDLQISLLRPSSAIAADISSHAASRPTSADTRQTSFTSSPRPTSAMAPFTIPNPSSRSPSQLSGASTTVNVGSSSLAGVPESSPRLARHLSAPHSPITLLRPPPSPEPRVQASRSLERTSMSSGLSGGDHGSAHSLVGDDSVLIGSMELPRSGSLNGAVGCTAQGGYMGSTSSTAPLDLLAHASYSQPGSPVHPKPPRAGRRSVAVSSSLALSGLLTDRASDPASASPVHTPHRSHGHVDLALRSSATATDSTAISQQHFDLMSPSLSSRLPADFERGASAGAGTSRLSSRPASASTVRQSPAQGPAASISELQAPSERLIRAGHEQVGGDSCTSHPSASPGRQQHQQQRAGNGARANTTESSEFDTAETCPVSVEVANASPAGHDGIPPATRPPKRRLWRDDPPLVGSSMPSVEPPPGRLDSPGGDTFDPLRSSLSRASHNDIASATTVRLPSPGGDVASARTWLAIGAASSPLSSFDDARTSSCASVRGDATDRLAGASPFRGSECGDDAVDCAASASLLRQSSLRQLHFLRQSVQESGGGDAARASLRGSAQDGARDGKDDEIGAADSIGQGELRQSIARAGSVNDSVEREVGRSEAKLAGVPKAIQRSLSADGRWRTWSNPVFDQPYTLM